MKITNEQDIRQIAFSHSSDIDYEDIANLYKKLTTKLLLHQIILYISERIF